MSPNTPLRSLRSKQGAGGMHLQRQNRGDSTIVPSAVTLYVAVKGNISAGIMFVSIFPFTRPLRAGRNCL
jgi:hypothetical protein